MTPKIHVNHDLWKAALKAAKIVAGKEDPYDVVQIRLKNDRAYMCAVNPKATLVIDLDGDIIEPGLEENEIIEFEKRDLDALIHMKFAKVESDDEVIVGINATDSAIRFTDESGFGIGTAVHDNQIPRNSEPAQLGNQLKAIKRAADQFPEDSSRPTAPFPEQIDCIAKVQRCFNRVAVIRQCDFGDKPDSVRKIYAAGTDWRLSTTALAEAREPEGEQEELRHQVKNAYVEVLTDVKKQSAKPPKGIA